MHIKEIALKKYGYIPDSIKDVFSNYRNGKEMFYDGLGVCLRSRKTNPFDRYIDIGRLVFGFLEEIYNFQKDITSKDKIKYVFRKDINESFWNTFLLNTIKNIHTYYKPCKCKAKIDYYFKEYKKMYTLSPQIDEYKNTVHHFIKKVQRGSHPFMTENLNSFFHGSEIDMEHLLFPFLIIESIIHGIDDYVDISKRNETEYSNDIINVVFGLFGLILYTLRNVKVKKSELIKISRGGKSRIEQLVDSLLFSLIELSQVPLIEKDTIRILKEEKRNEINTAKKNMKWRASGINIFLVYASIILGKEKDRNFSLLRDLIKDYRILELLDKDFYDISKDLRNRDYTPISVWWKKYKTRKDFNNIVKLLMNIYYIDSKILFRKITKYSDSKERIMKRIEEKYNKINVTIKV